jgi:hypothetical protein
MILDEVYDALHYVTFSILLVMYEHEKVTNIVGNYFGVSKTLFLFCIKTHSFCSILKGTNKAKSRTY